MRAKAAGAARARTRRTRSGRPPRRQWAPILVPVAVGTSLFVFGFGLGAARSVVQAPPSVQQVREQSNAELAARDQALLACRAAVERLRAPAPEPASPARAELDALAEQCRTGVAAPATTAAPAGG